MLLVHLFVLYVLVFVIFFFLLASGVGQGFGLWRKFLAALKFCINVSYILTSLIHPCFLYDYVRCPYIPFDRTLTGCTSEQGN